MVADQHIQVLLAMLSATLLFCALWLLMLRPDTVLHLDRGVAPVAALIEDDPAPVILADAAGAVQHANAEARRAFPLSEAPTLVAALSETFANPDRILHEMVIDAQMNGAVVRRTPRHEDSMRISVHRTGAAQFLWRFDIDTAGVGPQGKCDETALPTLEVGPDDAVLGLNPAAYALLGADVRSLEDVITTGSHRSGETCLIPTPEGPVDCLVIEREGGAGQRVIHLVPHARKVERGAEDWAFFEEMPVALLKLGRDGMIRQSNRPARDLLGIDVTRDLAFGDALEGLGRSIKDWIDDAASERGTVHAEFLRVRRDDREVFVQVTLNRAMEDGETVLIAVMNDATELKSLEAQFVQSQKMQAIGQLAGGVAHDFNNLLTAITGHCDLLLLRHDQGDPDYADLMQINQNANRAAALVSQLLAYSRKQTLRPQLVDLRETLADLTHLLNRLVGEKVSLGLSHDPALSSIRADKRQLEQVIMNLVVNARDAMPKGGEIRVQTENVTLTEPLRRDRAVVAPGRYVSVKIIDDGIGIAPDKAQKVFEPFFTTKRAGEGTGLGLSTAYGIVKQSGGFIFFDSVPQEGTVFQLLFPAHAPLENAGAAKTGDAVSAGPVSGVVLLVEDEAPVRAFAGRALRMRGYTVLEAESAEDALEFLEDPETHVDIFVTDVVMPGLDGPGWVQQALKARPGARVVFMSGYAEETFSEVQARIPNSVFLPKPFSLKELTDTVQRQTG
ncbi:ATP-binding protein [Roseovarius sp. D22-M7]|uniref:ATP-binding protein n=1 Tax=Roseovarius sp. D22-M7 TaxID=3127116 RepID=UPI003010065B